MPYIKQSARGDYIDIINAMKGEIDCTTTTGELNYLITRMIHMYTREHGNNYQTMNDVVGVLESAKAEYQRRVVAPYEDEKIEENGDL